MQSKVNIFTALHHASDSEEEADPQSQKTKKITEKKEQRANRDEKKQQAVAKQATVTGNLAYAKENHNKTKAPYKEKGVSGEAHPLDRHSGHNNQAYGEKAKKQGAGKGNWGNYKEDRKAPDTEDVTAGEPNEQVGEKVEEAPTGITLAEYYQNRQGSQNQPQVNEAKAKITSEQLTKELGGATVLKTKQQQQIDDKKVGRKKDRLDVDHKAAINSDNANLLNFRTGFIEKEYRPRGTDDVVPGGAPRTRAPRTGGKPEDSKQEEGQQAAEGQAAEGQAAEGQTAQGTAQEGTTAEGQAPAPTQGQDDQNRRTEGGRGGRGGRGGYRGGDRGGDRYQGDRQQGDRRQGDRQQGDRQQGDRQQGDRPQGDRPKKQQQGQGQLNFDDSAFPKLG